jgi:Fe-S-cluster containining protein
MTVGDWVASGVHFSCNRCGACCTGPVGEVTCSSAEIAAMARVVGVLPFEFRQRYVVALESGEGLRQIEREPGVFDCVFLSRDAHGARCTVHEARPTQCRTWPFWPAHLRNAEAYAKLATHCVGVRRGLEGEGRLHAAVEIEAAARATPAGLTSHHEVDEDGGRGFS